MRNDETLTVDGPIHIPSTRPHRVGLSKKVVAAAALLLLVNGPVLAAQTAGQRGCIVASHKGFTAVAKAEAKLAAACVKAAASGKLEDPTIEACVLADSKGKVAKASTKAMEKIAAACAEAPDFGATDLTGAAAVAQASGVRLAILDEMFGGELDTAIVLKAEDYRTAGCQAAVVKGVEACWKARLSAYGSCASSGLLSDITDAAGLAACRLADPSGKVADACGEGLRDDLSQPCAGVATDLAIPGCECRYLENCIETTVGNRGNAAVGAVAGLPSAPDLLPTVRVPQASSVPGPWVSAEHGPFVASRLLGRESDAPLACPLGAVNIYTILDAQADADYNDGILPYLLQQRVRVTYLGQDPVEVLPGGDPLLLQQEHAMPLYADARDFLRLSTRREVYDLVDLKAAQVGTTLNFGFEHCLHDCDALYASVFPPFVFSGHLLVHHFRTDRATLEAAVPLLAAEAESATGVRLVWAGRAVADFKLELVDGSVVQAFNALPADGTLVYELDGEVDPAADVVTMPQLAAFLAATTSDTVLAIDVAALPFP